VPIDQVTSGLWRYRTAAASDEPERTFILAPYAGGNAYSLAEWLPPLVGDCDIAYLLQYPGRGSRLRDPIPANLADLADEAAEALQPYRPHQPVLVGHSMGAVLGYELAHRLAAFGQDPALLVVSASRAPHRSDLDPVVLTRLTSADWVALMLADGFVDADKMPPDMLHAAVSALRADCLLVARHIPADHKLRCPILALGGASDPAISAEDLTEWTELTTGTATAHLFPGGHFYYRGQLGAIAALIDGAVSHEPLGRHTLRQSQNTQG
jgi:surfactin synthase thioesterase subunit